MKIDKIGITLAVLSLSACSTPPLTFSVSNVPPAARKIDAALISSIVTLAPKGEAKGSIKIAGGEDDIAGLWKSALDDALLRSAVFDDASSRRLTLSVRIYQLGYGVLGMGVNAIARYELVERSTGQAVFVKEITTRGTASDYIGDNRVRNAASRAVSENIAEFIATLPEVQL